MPFVAQDLGHIMKRRRLTDRIITYLFYQLLRGLKVSFVVFLLIPVNDYKDTWIKEAFSWETFTVLILILDLNPQTQSSLNPRQLSATSM